MPRTRRPKTLIAPLAAALLIAGLASCTEATSGTAPVAIAVDAAANRHPISPLIYGINFGNTATLRDLRVPINRSGGNSASAYNWRLDARNAGKDWYFESVGVSATDINDQFGDRFVTLTQAGGATPIVTIPMLGRVAKLGPQRQSLASFSIAKYGPQPNHDVDGLTDAGNGMAAGDVPITGNDPNDATVPDDAQNEQARVAALVAQFGNANAGGVRYYAMDNEPSLWHEVHRDVHPTGAHAREIADKVVTYSRAVKAADPHAKVVAPEEWGWAGYFHSGFDQQNAAAHGYDHAPDRENETQGMDYVPWLLSQWKAAGHPVDVFSLHFYPQGGEYTDSNAANGSSNANDLALKRNRSTRDLWDPHYTDPTWINSVVALIPLMRHWVDTYYYPGTPIALTEYNWGGETLMSGATAQADLLGIFGREGLDIATRWGTIDASMPVYKAIKLYRNYDGKGGAFGATSVAANVPDPDTVAAFAALRNSDHALTLVVINKQLDHSAETAISIANFAANGVAQNWQLANNQLARAQDVHYTNGVLRATLPPQSVTLFVLHGGAS
ncbi:glycoside hydrolase family 44 protein [Burkholderia sp. Ax-1719]|uniref:glycoside hydrolase family 44 protein n=1 Tax=Burkholderia sp. Ax-1719 TaxID=2608334 RepID=UPI0014221431|nr:glycoside hydrolase family 44 protein [Burkholderia sp. Ax-1719]NIE64162.1 cellulase [Burkholderia sp. Ax-1719]